ncbi:hypothetical protein SYNPS1DRAFT_31513 [Syncephalis pseudoplumigaleata]|uniref:Uncharacterized protein n=1 Tax=Syncephalis pseudoplumigaleata TaxID=1712513 RepID=A0A4V1J0V0_9FUNG|nr:hypothetical protein SYNPS1DRAFT_31513 [Syncephalis pseudoplumigaleata]|eukprot:RKP22829.1 hypothetical protein SYNPS1DRAFT_31513 [Syncephalis pseudoplumigaleata]
MSPSAPPPVSVQEEEAMSSAYIAQLLAQEEAYAMSADAYDLYGDYDDYRPSTTTSQDDAWAGAGRKRRPTRADSDWEADDGEDEEDYHPKPGRRRRGGGVGGGSGGGMRGRRPVSGASTPRQPLKTKSLSNESGDAADTGNDATADGSAGHAPGAGSATIDENGDVVPSAKKPRRARPKLEGMNQGAYTPEEEERFLDGLELYGRGWNDISRYIGTRDSHSIRSHAQKYFIRLFRDNKPLPAKVRESGEGYTLSGLALDPESAAARTYLSRYDPTEKTAAAEANALGTSLVVARTSTPLSPLPVSMSASSDNTTTTAAVDEHAAKEGEEEATRSDVIAFGQAPTPLKTKNKPRQPEQSAENAAPTEQETASNDNANNNNDDDGGGGVDEAGKPATAAVKPLM